MGVGEYLELPHAHEGQYNQPKTRVAWVRQRTDRAAPGKPGSGPEGTWRRNRCTTTRCESILWYTPCEVGQCHGTDSRPEVAELSRMGDRRVRPLDPELGLSTASARRRRADAACTRTVRGSHLTTFSARVTRAVGFKGERLGLLATGIDEGVRDRAKTVSVGWFRCVPNRFRLPRTVDNKL